MRYCTLLYSMEFLFCKLFILLFIISHNLWGPSKYHCGILSYIINAKRLVVQTNHYSLFVTGLWFTYYRLYTYKLPESTYLKRVCTRALHTIWSAPSAYTICTLLYLHVYNMKTYIANSTLLKRLVGLQ